jgi:hypothetical protein
MGWIHNDPLPAFESTATQAFALNQRLSSLRTAYVPDDKTAATLRALLKRFA